MKGLKKSKSLEVEAEKMEKKEKKEKTGKDSQQKEAKKPRKNRFLAWLQGTWRRITASVRRRASRRDRENPEEHPGPSTVDIVDCSVNVSHDEKEASWEIIEPSQASFGCEDWEEPKSEREENWENEAWEYGPSPINIRVNISHEEKEKEDSWEETELSEAGFGGQDWVEENWEEEPQKEREESWENEAWEYGPIPISIGADDNEGAPSATVSLSRDCFTFHCALGEGYYGKVYLATDKLRKQSVAVKAMVKRRIVKHGYFFEERDVLQISHKCPHLIHGLGTFQTPTHIYYVMELATGGSLRDLQNNFTLEPSPIQFIAAELACGVLFLHKNAIIHRDLKPDNILVAGDGHIKVTDFGLAATGVTESIRNWHAGTPGYIAPEVVNVHPHGPAADYFAIGVIVYEMCTGYLPFSQLSADKFMEGLRCGASYPNCMADDIVAFIDRLLCEDQTRRLGVKGDIREHFYFKDINWEEMEAGRAEPPEILKTFSAVRQSMIVPEQEEISNEDQDRFNQFGFVCPEWSQQYHPVMVRKA